MGLFDKAKDTIFGKDYGKKDKKNLDSVWGPASGQIASLYGGAYANQTKALQSVKQGYGAADQAVVKGGAQAAKTISETYSRGAASDRLSAASRGLASTGALDAMRRGNRLDRAKSLAALDAEISGLRANLQVGRGQAVAGAYGNMAGTQMGYGGMLAGIAANRSAQYGQLQYGRQGGLLAAAAPMIGAAAGGAFGGPMGAQMGAQAGGQFAQQFQPQKQHNWM